MATIKKDVRFTGHGIHSGAMVNLVVHPSDVRGIFFRRVDLPGNELIPARYDNVCDTKMRNTTIGNIDGAHVKTIEHLMAALFVAEVDSAIVEIDGPEAPIMDGSAIDFYTAIKSVGVTGKSMQKIVVRKPIIVRAADVIKDMPFCTRLKVRFFNLLSGRKSDGFEKLSPSENGALNISATIVYPEKIIGHQAFRFSFDGSKKAQNEFEKNVATARTFGKISEWEYLKAHGMAHGANENNVIVVNVDGDGTINKTYFPDEFVRHKIVDAIGDMFSSGGFIVGNLESYKGSHAMNNLLLKKLFSNPNNYDIMDA